jgi:hypothetical protein
MVNPQLPVLKLVELPITFLGLSLTLLDSGYVNVPDVTVVFLQTVRVLAMPRIQLWTERDSFGKSGWCNR